MNRTILLPLLILIFQLIFLQLALAIEYPGKVVGIHNGDTITVLTAAKGQVKVRLAEIDTPESKQPLSDKVFFGIQTEVQKWIRIQNK